MSDKLRNVDLNLLTPIAKKELGILEVKAGYDCFMYKVTLDKAKKKEKMKDFKKSYKNAVAFNAIVSGKIKSLGSKLKYSKSLAAKVLNNTKSFAHKSAQGDLLEKDADLDIFFRDEAIKVNVQGYEAKFNEAAEKIEKMKNRYISTAEESVMGMCNWILENNCIMLNGKKFDQALKETKKNLKVSLDLTKNKKNNGIPLIRATLDGVKNELNGPKFKLENENFVDPKNLEILKKEMKTEIRKAFEALKEAVQNNTLMDDNADSRDGYVDIIKKCYENFEEKTKLLSALKKLIDHMNRSIYLWFAGGIEDHGKATLSLADSCGQWIEVCKVHAVTMRNLTPNGIKASQGDSDSQDGPDFEKMGKYLNISHLVKISLFAHGLGFWGQHIEASKSEISAMQ